MFERLPIKNLVKLNWIITLLLSVIVFVFSLAVVHNILDAAVRALQSLVLMSVISFSNLWLRKLFAEKIENNWLSQIWFYLLSYVITVIVWLIVKELHLILAGSPWEGETAHVFRAYMLAILSVSIFDTLVIVLQDLVILQHKKAQAEIENLTLQTNISETANLLLKQQIYPHFLFNALNTIKSLYKKDLQQGEDYLVHLANFLRVSISNHSTKTTLIKNELDFCLDYLKMQKIRFGVSLNYSISISDEVVQNYYLPFFSLQPLVENVLKHNDLTEERPIMITIKEQKGYLLVSNNLQLSRYKEPSTGMGLSNLAERYRLLNEKGISITSDSSFFTVSIKILDK